MPIVTFEKGRVRTPLRAGAGTRQPADAPLGAGLAKLGALHGNDLSRAREFACSRAARPFISSAG